MAKYQHIKHFMDFQGIDLRSSDILTSRNFAKKGDNCAHAPQGGLTCRRGAKIDQSGAGTLARFGYGTFRLDTVDIVGIRKTELLTLGYDGLLYRAKRNSFTIANTTGVTVSVSMYYVTSQFLFVVQGNTTLVSQGLGLGTEGAPYNITSLEAVVDGVIGLAMSTPSSAPAAFMDIIPDVAIATGTSGTFYYTVFEQVTHAFPLTNYRPVTHREIGSDNFEVISGCVINGVLYLSSGPNVPATPPSSATITKYDGQRFYRAGMKVGFSAVGTDIAPAVLTDAKGVRARAGWASESFGYYVTYKQVDKTGNIVENLTIDGGLSSSASGFVNQVIRVALIPPDNLTLAELGFNDAHAIKNGSASLQLSHTVDAGHGLVAGDIAYFWDENQDQWIQREVVSVTPTTITLSATSLDSDTNSPTYDLGGPVTVNDNAVFSNNLRIAIWRLDSTGQLATLVEEIAYHPHTAPYAEAYDEGPAFDWGAEYVAPAYFFMTGTPQGRYVCSYNNHLIITGNDKRSTTVFFSDLDSPELFGVGTHEFDLQTRVTGCQQTSEVLCIGEQDALNIVSGDLGNFAFRVDKIGNKIGVISHHSMKEVQEGVMPFLSLKGPYVLIGGRALEPVGGLTYPDGSKVSRIEPVFSKVYDQSVSHPAFRRAMAGALSAKALYVLFIPFESPLQYGFANTDSVAYVFDYSRGAWFKWTGDAINMAGGIAEFEETLWWAARAYDGSGTFDATNTLMKLHQFQPETKGKYAYADHNAAIAWDYRSAWEHLGQPAHLKRFLRNRMSSHEPRPSASSTFTMSTYVDFDESELSFTSDITFTNEKDLKEKIKAEVCRSIQVRYQQAVMYDPMILTGYELEIVAGFRQEMRE